MTPYAVNASLTEARGVIVLWFQRKVQGVVASNHSLSIIVVPPFGPELKFEPELLRTGLRSSPRFEGQVEPNLLFGPWFS